MSTPQQQDREFDEFRRRRRAPEASVTPRKTFYRIGSATAAPVTRFLREANPADLEGAEIVVLPFADPAFYAQSEQLAIDDAGRFYTVRSGKAVVIPYLIATPKSAEEFIPGLSAEEARLSKIPPPIAIPVTLERSTEEQRARVRLTSDQVRSAALSESGAVRCGQRKQPVPTDANEVRIIRDRDGVPLNWEL